MTWGLQKISHGDIVAEAEAAVVIMHNRAGKDENLTSLPIFAASLSVHFHRLLAPEFRSNTYLDVGIICKTSR
jgi:hypothetical protein